MPSVLPIIHNKLLAQWKGLYEVLERVTYLNYILLVQGKRKHFHINTLNTPAAPYNIGITISRNAEYWVACLNAARPIFSPSRVVPGADEILCSAAIVHDMKEHGDGPVAL